MQSLTTERLMVRPFLASDFPAIHQILCRAFNEPAEHHDDPTQLAERRAWLDWAIACAEWFPKLHQPPYGERAIVARSSGALLGSIGFVPCLDRYQQIPELNTAAVPSGATTTELGMFWAIDPQFQGHGFASEAARAMVDYAFAELGIYRIIAATEYDNLGSQGVMRKIGMTLGRNQHAEPPWLQVVGVKTRGE